MAFIDACRSGNIERAKRMYSLGKVDIHADNEEAFNEEAFNEEAFTWICGNGYTKIAKWLYSLGKVDIHADNEEAFRLSCGKGHTEIAKWLYGLGNVNIHVNEEAFIWSCSNDYAETAEWLYSLTPKYELIINDNRIVDWKIYTTKELLDIHKKKFENVHDELIDKRYAVRYKPDNIGHFISYIHYRLSNRENKDNIYAELIKSNHTVIDYLGIKNSEHMVDQIEIYLCE